MRCSLACVLLLVACYHDAPVRPAAPPSNAIEVRRPSGHDYRETIADPVGFLPLDSEVVLSLDGDQLRKSKLWKQLEPALLAKAGTQLAMFKTLCKVDPIQSIHTLALGMKHVESANPDGVIVVHGLDRDPLMACLAAGQSAQRKVRIADGIVTVEATGADPNNVLFRFVDRTTVVIVIGVSADRDLLERVIAAGSPLRASPTFNEMFQLIDTSASLWALFNGNSKLFDKAGAMGMKPKALFGSLSLSDGMLFNLRMRLGTAADVTQLVAMAQGQIGSAKALVDRLEITADNLDVVVVVAMTDQQIQSLIGMFGGIWGSSFNTPRPAAKP